MKTTIYFFLALVILTSAYSNTYEYRPLTSIPAAEDIIAFTNGKRPVTGTRQKVTKEEIQKYLAHGTPIVERSKWIWPSGYTDSNQKDGVFFDSLGRAYFWSIRIEGALVLETENGESIQIILKNEN